jgi:hypothetical protein
MQEMQRPVPGQAPGCSKCGSWMIFQVRIYRAAPATLGRAIASALVPSATGMVAAASGSARDSLRFIASGEPPPDESAAVGQMPSAGRRCVRIGRSRPTDERGSRTTGGKTGDSNGKRGPVPLPQGRCLAQRRGDAGAVGRSSGPLPEGQRDLNQDFGASGAAAASGSAGGGALASASASAGTGIAAWAPAALSAG